MMRVGFRRMGGRLVYIYIYKKIYVELSVFGTQLILDFPYFDQKIIRPFQILVHEEGKNLLSTPENAIDVMSVVFDAYECIAGTPGSSARDDYDKLCSSRSRGCTVTGPTQFFNNSRTQYVDDVQGDGTTLIDTISNLLYPNGARVLRSKFLIFSIYYIYIYTYIYLQKCHYPILKFKS